MTGAIASDIAPVIRSVEVKVFTLVSVGNSLGDGDTNRMAADGERPRLAPNRKIGRTDLDLPHRESEGGRVEIVSHQGCLTLIGGWR
jgi:hypothetical protein